VPSPAPRKPTAAATISTYVEFQKNHEQGMTPSTPVISLIYALQSKLEDIKAEGIENRYARHARLNRTVRERARERLHALPEGRPRLGDAELLRQHLGYDLAALNKTLKSKHRLVIDGGYGKLKGKTFRISNMGDETDETIAAMLKPRSTPRSPRRRNCPRLKAERSKVPSAADASLPRGSRRLFFRRARSNRRRETSSCTSPSR
jgi:hypothetical protein